jgi:hypothetical protein
MNANLKLHLLKTQSRPLMKQSKGVTKKSDENLLKRCITIIRKTKTLVISLNTEN